ncbi:putative tyrosine carboxypeptidase MATCAP2 isoform X2 [Stegostoma tigrinum]|uniref:putative tyrosine carboxypeptidase MATCAP2 isoform X2 n=1 Tax=Stegostoma tigrinum TaxID=3053191 RepID=UPI00286FBC48|nr:putative tyrosine carboxypeptidase MATCAP2 isoform X2 [Stegostoma tigrinum]
MLESIRVTEKLRWPELELAKKSVLLNPAEKNDTSQADLQQVSVSILKEIFTGSNGYNVLLPSKGEKKRLSSSHHKKHRKSAKPSAVLQYKERRTPSSSVPMVDKEWCLGSGHTALLMGNLVASDSKFPLGISMVGSGIGLSQRPKNKIKRLYFSSLHRSSLPVGQGRISESHTRRLCILTAVKPSNVEKEKVKFFKSEFTYNPQFEYANPALPNVLAKHGIASDKFLLQVLPRACRRHGLTGPQVVKSDLLVESNSLQQLAIKIMKMALKKYGSYEKFEQATGGNLLTKSRIWFYVKKYMEREDCLGDIAVHLTDDLLSRASMTIVNGRPTLTINVSTAREHWLEGMLRHEIGTHYLRGLNNNLQPWCNWNGRKKYGLKPINPTEEGLASIHSVLFHKDPFLWRAALLYYTVYQASHMSFRELFLDIGKFVENPNTRWDYCVRAKRGQTDTSQPGCFSKDQVYLDGILKILRHRDNIDFQLLTALGKVSYEDVDRLKVIALLQNAQIPYFMQDQSRYLEQLDKIMEVNGLTDCELQILV